MPSNSSMTVEVPAIVTIDELSKVLKISKSKIYREWASWRDYGVKPLQLRPNDRPRFYLDQVLKMMEAPK